MAPIDPPPTFGRIVVLGGAGFIGSHLCDRLRRDGSVVVCVDDLSTGDPRNIGHLADDPAFRFVHQDVTRGIHVDGPIDVVFHLASPASPVAYLSAPTATLRAGSLGTFHAVELAAARGARLVFASTSEVYGDPTVHPQPESYVGHVDPIGPRSVYDEAKRFGEAVVASAIRERAVDGRIARIFNTVGSRMRPDDGRVIPAWATQILAGRPVTVHGDGAQTRSFTDVDDTVDGLVRLAGSDERRPVNIGNPDEHPILDAVGWVAEALDRPYPPIAFEPRMQGDPVRRCPDIARAVASLGWSPALTARDAVMRAARSFRDVLEVV